MKMRKIIILLASVLLLASSFGLANAAIIELDFTSPLIVTDGDIFTVDIVGSDFTVGSGGTSGGGLNFAWDPTLLTLNSVTSTFAGDEFFGDPGVINSGAGTLTGFSVSSIVGTPDAAFSIATLNFTAGGSGVPGTSVANIEIDVLDVWADFDGLVNVNPTAVDGSIQVNAVPIPASLLLLGSGLIGLVGLRKKNG